MRTKAVATVLLACGILILTAGCEQIVTKFKEQEAKRHAKFRVTYILETLQVEGGATNRNVQTAICRWWKDVAILGEPRELELAMDEFDAWRKKKGIFKGVKSFEITGVDLVPGTEPPIVIVSGTVNGKAFKMKVPHEAPITWA